MATPGFLTSCVWRLSKLFVLFCTKCSKEREILLNPPFYIPPVDVLTRPTLPSPKDSVAPLCSLPPYPGIVLLVLHPQRGDRKRA